MTCDKSDDVLTVQQERFLQVFDVVSDAKIDIEVAYGQPAAITFTEPSQLAGVSIRLDGTDAEFAEALQNLALTVADAHADLVTDPRVGECQRLMAHVVGLAIEQREDGPWLVFAWEGEDWQGALEAIKARIPAAARTFDEQTRLWSVDAVFESELCSIFPNFESSLDAIRSQIGMGF